MQRLCRCKNKAQKLSKLRKFNNIHGQINPNILGKEHIQQIIDTKDWWEDLKIFDIKTSTVETTGAYFKMWWQIKPVKLVQQDDAGENNKLKERSNHQAA